MEWFRWYHGDCDRALWPLIAHRAGASVSEVVAVWAALLECASRNDERGGIGDFDPETYDFFFGCSSGTCAAVVAAMTAKGLIADGCIAGWEKRQYARERVSDGAASSTERVRRYREKKRQETACNADETPVTHETPVTPETPRGGESPVEQPVNRQETDVTARAPGANETEGGIHNMPDLQDKTECNASVTAMKRHETPVTHETPIQNRTDTEKRKEIHPPLPPQCQREPGQERQGVGGEGRFFPEQETPSRRVQENGQPLPITQRTETPFAEDPATRGDMGFQQLVDAYPQHRVGSREEARLVWLGTPHKGLPRLLDGLCRWMDSEQWTKEGGRYIPSLANFLRKRYWEQDPPENRQPTWDELEAEAAREREASKRRFFAWVDMRERQEAAASALAQ